MRWLLVGGLGLWLAFGCVGPVRRGPGAVAPAAPPAAPAPGVSVPRAPAAGPGGPAGATARAQAAEITVRPSGDRTGVTDAAAIQRALTGPAPGTVVQLEAGDYYLGRALVADGFVGTLRGAGMDATTVHVTGTIRHLTPSEGDCRGTRNDGSLHARPTPANPGPFVLSVLGGDLTLSDLTFTTVPGATAEFCLFQQKGAIIPGFVLVAGRARGSRILRVRFTGHPGSFLGYDIIQATYQEGLLYGSRDDRPEPVTGRHLIEGCDFEHVFAGSSVENAAAEAVIELRHNTYGVDTGPGLPLMEGLEVWSTAGEVRLEHNVIRTSGEGVVVVQGISEHLGFLLGRTGTGKVRVAHNRIVAGNGAVDALDLTDLQPALFGAHALDVEVERNHLVLHGARYGIVGNGLAGARFVGNTFEGRVVRDGIALGAPAPRSAYGVRYPPATYPTVGCRIEGNDLTHLEAGRHRVLLGPYTSGCVVVGRSKVANAGQGNRVVPGRHAP